VKKIKLNLEARGLISEGSLLFALNSIFILSADDIKALGDAVKESPKVKKITRLVLNLSSSELKLRDMKELGAFLIEKTSLEQIILIASTRTTGWTLLNTLVDGDSSVTSVILEGLEFPDAWSGAQCSKVLSHCKWTEFIIRQCTQKPSAFSSAEASPFYDNLGFGLNSNESMKSVGLIDIPGASNGDIDKLLFRIRRNKTITRLELSLEDLWDRIKVRNLAEFIQDNTTIEELIIRGAEENIFDVTEFVTALEKSQSLKKVVLKQLELKAGGVKGFVKVDTTLRAKLSKIVEANEKLTLEVADYEISKKP